MGADAVEGTSVQFEKPGQMMDMGTVDPHLTLGVSSSPSGLSVNRRVFRGQPNRFPM